VAKQRERSLKEWAERSFILISAFALAQVVVGLAKSMGINALFSAGLSDKEMAERRAKS
jgi:hypothetical protein